MDDKLTGFGREIRIRRTLRH